jgi:hypothetical protein
MKYKFTNGSITRNLNGTYALTIELARDINANALNDIIRSDKLKSCTIEYDKKKRTLTANGSLWLLLQKMAEVLHTSKEELYLRMLEKYGQFTYVIVKESAVDMMSKQFRLVRNLGHKTVGGQSGIQLQCYYGSSTYDKQMFGHLLDGVISEAKELGIEFISREDRMRLIEEME